MAIISGIIAAVTSVVGAISSFIGGLGVIGSFLIKTAAGIGLNLLAKAIAGTNAPEKVSFSVQGKLQSGGTVERSIIIGRTATAGSLVYANTWGTANKTPNAYITQVIALADYPVKSITGLLVNGVYTEFESVAHPTYGLPVKEYRLEGKDFLWIKFYDGTQTEADRFLVDTVSSDSRPYEPERVGRGVAYAICTSRVQEELFTGFPQFKFIIDGARLYDPSKDSSIGGIGAHRWLEPATWGGNGDHNPVVQIYNLLRGIRWSGQWLYGIQTAGARRIPSAHAIQQIGKCNALVEGPDGNEPTYRSGAEIQVGAPLRDAVEGILTAAQGRIAEIGGTYKTYVGQPDDPVMSFTDEDILSTEAQTFTPFFGLADTINGITATYPSPEDGWNPAEAPPLYNAAYELEDGGRRLLADVDLDFVPYKGQVQRLLKSALAEARRARRHTIVMPPKFWVLEPGDTIAWTSVRNGYEAKRFRIDGVIDNPNLDVVLDITEVDPTDYDWHQDTDYRTPTSGSFSPGYPPAQPMYGWQAFPDVLRDDDGVARRPTIRIECDPDQDDVKNVWVQVRLKSTEAIVFDSQATPYAEPYKWVLNGTFLGLTTYQARGRFVPYSNRATEWSGWIDVTTDDVRFGQADIDYAAVSKQIREDSQIFNKWIYENLRDTIDRQRDLARAAAEQDLANYNDKKFLLTTLRAGDEDVRASYEESILVATGPESAIALALRELNAVLGDAQAGAFSSLQTLVDRLGNATSDLINSLTATSGANDISEANFRIGVMAGPNGTNSRIGFSVRARGEGAFRNAGIYLDATPTSAQVLIDAERFAVIAGGQTKHIFVVDENGLAIDTAYIRNITTASITFLDGSVQTEAIAPSAVTATVAVVAGGGSTGTGEATLTNGVVAVVPSSTVDVSFMTSVQNFELEGNIGALPFTIRLRRDGVVIYSVTGYVPLLTRFTESVGDTNTRTISSYGGIINFFYTDMFPSAGNRNYAISIQPVRSLPLAEKAMRATVYKR